MKNKIPKIIHFCWFGNNKFPSKVSECIKSWKNVLPEYEIMMWSEANFDVNKIPFCKEAYENKKYAFVSDYVRFYALYKFGGIYLDTDVEILKSFDTFLDNEIFGFINKGNKSVVTWFIGMTRQHEFAGRMLEYYKNRHFVKTDGSLDLTPNTCVGELFYQMYGFSYENKNQCLAKGCMLYSNDYVGAHNFTTGRVNISTDTYCIHWNEASWWSDEARVEYKKLQQLRRIFGVKIADVLYRVKCRLLR